MDREDTPVEQLFTERERQCHAHDFKFILGMLRAENADMSSVHVPFPYSVAVRAVLETSPEFGRAFSRTENAPRLRRQSPGTNRRRNRAP